MWRGTSNIAISPATINAMQMINCLSHSWGHADGKLTTIALQLLSSVSGSLQYKRCVEPLLLTSWYCSCNAT